MAMPLEMFSLTSSCTRLTLRLTLLLKCKALFSIAGHQSREQPYLRVGAEGKFSQCTSFGQVNEQEEKRQGFTMEKGNVCISVGF